MIIKVEMEGPAKLCHIAIYTSRFKQRITGSVIYIFSADWVEEINTI